ncbi:hypothetical protein EUGRSUZ_J00490 [Eucalyptus grandis]|uniref:Uncharacterized protein n=2 Tax=Eucalyptus grandis TaxID=71139 RepID=A0A059ABT1_EUCGR|nr:hypothetical protein EUGRSUZ_J00490 [Eucalyptus grandis]
MLTDSTHTQTQHHATGSHQRPMTARPQVIDLSQIPPTPTTTKPEPIAGTSSPHSRSLRRKHRIEPEIAKFVRTPPQLPEFRSTDGKKETKTHEGESNELLPQTEKSQAWECCLNPRRRREEVGGKRENA